MSIYHYLPKGKFTLRMLAPAALVFVFGIVAMGGVASLPALQPYFPWSDGVAPAQWKDGRTPSAKATETGMFAQAAAHPRNLAVALAHAPKACVSGNVQSDVQRRICDDFWNRVGIATAVLAIPLFAVALFYYFMFDSLTVTYRRARRRFENGKIAVRGIITDPPELPNDFYGWMYCLRAVCVQLQNGKQVKVYLPLDAPASRPGDPLIGVEVAGGRYLAMAYTPHVAVVLGS